MAYCFSCYTYYLKSPYLYLFTYSFHKKRLSSSSPGENMDNKIRRPTKICTFDAQGWCKKGKSCISLHEREGLGSAKAGLLAPVGSGNHRGSEEGSQVQHKSDLKVPQFKGSEGSSKDEMYRNLIYAFGKDNQTSVNLAGKHSLLSTGVSQRMSVSIGDSLAEKPTAHANELAQNLVHENNNKRFMADHIGLAAENYLDARAPSSVQSDIEKADLHRYLDAGKGCGASSSGPALLVSSKPEPFMMPVGSHSPIKDEVWETSVPFIPSFSFPDSTTHSESQYDPFVDYVKPSKVGNTNNLKPSNISCNISSQHTNLYAIADKSLNYNGKLTRSITAKEPNEPACLITPDRGRSSSLDDTIKAYVDRHNIACHPTFKYSST
ncbi:hypothetical protein Zm00014a_036905 [Zea mays]|uniref:Zinc finger CCCH domain-containing protein 36 n=1 Tax=Zea mays TaxID=4577 RepID=A0A3L6DSQ4_MAIZE|nr:hypothetical protein Zm00014a_036905 [Zea mays]PWZ11427.1 Zinc finger CCCH domain-containing protein 36 [Zea mays]PWZ11428.1 hypothetical protein Zm00014a_036905 [Zea mays]PWZ11429.1 hypothetical protein Zm00014a_036905 [Zea mays]